MFYLFGLSIAFFLVLLILGKRSKTGADYILLTWMVVIILHLLLFYLEHTHQIYSYSYLIGLALPLPVLHGALLYFYTIKTTRIKFLNPAIIFACLLPFLLLTVLAIPFFISSPEIKIQVFKNHGQGFEWFLIIQSILIPTSGLFFSTITIIEIRKYRKQLVTVCSNIDKKMLQWLEYLAIGLGLIWVVAVFFDDPVIFAGAVMFVLLIGLFGINQLPVFYAQQITDIPSSESNATDNVQTPDPEESNKYSKSGLKEQDAIRLKEYLEDFMNSSKPYKNPDLTLDGLSGALKIPSNQVSQIINSLEGKTFYHYVNTYRINEFLKMADQPESKRFTYLGIAYDCGFNSKTTFNKYFKILTGKTPSDYFGNQQPANIQG